VSEGGRAGGREEEIHTVIPAHGDPPTVGNASCDNETKPRETERVSLEQVTVCNTHTHTHAISHSFDLEQVAAPIFGNEPGQEAGEVSGMIFLYDIYKGMKVTHDSFDFDNLAQDYVSDVAQALAHVVLPPMSAIRRALRVQAHNASGFAGEGQAVWQTFSKVLSTVA